MSLSDEKTSVIANFKGKSKVVSYVYPEDKLKQALKEFENMIIDSPSLLLVYKEIFGEELLGE